MNKKRVLELIATAEGHIANAKKALDKPQETYTADEALHEASNCLMMAVVEADDEVEE